MAKKTFRDSLENPALQFISKPVAETTPAPATKAPEGYKLDPRFIETKSKRVQLLVKPSTVAKIRERANAEGRSLNDLVNSILEEYIERS